MEGIFIYFLGVLAYNIAPSFIAFGVAFYMRRKRYPITWSRGGAVLIVGWLLGSIVVFLVRVVAIWGGIGVENTPGLETAITLFVLLPVMFLLLDASKPKSLPPATQ